MSIMLKSSHLIKLVHAVQSLKRDEREKNKTRRESGQIIKYKLIKCFESESGAMNCIWKIKKRYGRLPHSGSVSV